MFVRSSKPIYSMEVTELLRKVSDFITVTGEATVYTTFRENEAKDVTYAVVIVATSDRSVADGVEYFLNEYSEKHVVPGIPC